MPSDIPEHFSPEAKKIINDIRSKPYTGGAPEQPPLVPGAPLADCLRVNEEARFILKEHLAKKPKVLKKTPSG